MMWEGSGKMRTRLTELLNIQYPIIQGGLANLAFAELAAAVSNAGGLGQITAASFPNVQQVREEIRKTRQLTDNPFGVNVAISEYHGVEELLDVIMEEKVQVITLTGGNPEPILRRLEGSPIRKLILVASVRQAKKAESAGADAVMAVGQEGGGHLGREDTGTMVLVPQVVDAVKIPVVASGGIADGRQLLAALCLGAAGIEMGTRFVATKECIAHQAYKEAIVHGTETDTVVIERSIGAPGRVVRTPWADEILRKESNHPTREELYPYISGERNRKAIWEGKLDEGFGWAGQSMGLIHSVPTVAEMFADLLTVARTALRDLNGLE